METNKTDRMGSLRRTHYCGVFRKEDEGKTVTVCGWVQRQRDLGQLIFIDLRDRTGIVQLAFDDKTDRDLFDRAFHIRSEYVLIATGEVRIRSSINHEIPTGDVEIKVTGMKLLATAETTPFEILDDVNAKEELRLRYRYLDLRRPVMQEVMMARHKIVKCARDYYDQMGFLEIETPVLIKSTPEGARDYLVPSRVIKNHFFALPQSPQLYKQLLMLSGFDRYMQIARCFRDEDLRADRQPEFTQIDLEMSFVDEDDVMEVNEGFIKYLFQNFMQLDIPTPFPRMRYDEAMRRFGSDKPDTRFGFELTDLGGILTNCEFRVFAGALSAGGKVMGINFKGAAAEIKRKEIDKLTEWVKDYGARGLAFLRLTADGESSSYEKFLSDEEKAGIRSAVDAADGDLILIVADGDSQVVYDSLGALRCEVANRLGIIPEDRFDFLWVTDFPLLEYDRDEDRYVAKHHPFTAPKDEDLPKCETNPAEVRAKAYDLVLNGTEIGGGSIRINNPEIQEMMFRVLGFTPESTKERFGFLIDAFQYGAPPHGGMAYGLDRLCMLMLKKDSIRDVIAFPKTASSAEPMTGAPGRVDKSQLDELYIELKQAETAEAEDHNE